MRPYVMYGSEVTFLREDQLIKQRLNMRELYQLPAHIFELRSLSTNETMKLYPVVQHDWTAIRELIRRKPLYRERSDLGEIFVQGMRTYIKESFPEWQLQNVQRWRLNTLAGVMYEHPYNRIIEDWVNQTSRIHFISPNQIGFDTAHTSGETLWEHPTKEKTIDGDLFVCVGTYVLMDEIAPFKLTHQLPLNEYFPTAELLSSLIEKELYRHFPFLELAGGLSELTIRM